MSVKTVFALARGQQETKGAPALRYPSTSYVDKTGEAPPPVHLPAACLPGRREGLGEGFVFATRDMCQDTRISEIRYGAVLVFFSKLDVFLQFLELGINFGNPFFFFSRRKVLVGFDLQFVFGQVQLADGQKLAVV